MLMTTTTMTMSGGLTADRVRTTGRTYTEQEWERVKEPFRFYYMEKNMALRDAARMMKENHGFEATLRQWERRIAPEKWGFQKYANRDTRLKAIQEAGKSLLEVSDRGRRKSTASDDRPPLQEDRNMRRFARREVSREARRRARSVSELSDNGNDYDSDADMSGTSAAPSPSLSARMVKHDIGAEQEPLPDFWMPLSVTESFPVPPLNTYPMADSDMNTNVPQIFISGHESDAFGTAIAPGGTQIKNSFPEFSLSSHNYPVFEAVPVASDFNPLTNSNGDAFVTSSAWSEPFSAQSSANEPFPSFKFDQEPPLPHIMHVDTGSPPPITTDVPNVVVTRELRLEQAVQTPITPAGIMAAHEDPVHADVHALLHEHYSATLEMVDLCVATCQKTRDPEVMLKSVELLRSSLRAQNVESDRGIRRTLKNVAIIQRRATQNIRDLSTQRKRKIEQLQSQIEALNTAMSTTSLEEPFTYD